MFKSPPINHPSMKTEFPNSTQQPAIKKSPGPKGYVTCAMWVMFGATCEKSPVLSCEDPVSRGWEGVWGGGGTGESQLYVNQASLCGEGATRSIEKGSGAWWERNDDGANRTLFGAFVISFQIRFGRSPAAPKGAGWTRGVG